MAQIKNTSECLITINTAQVVERDEQTGKVINVEQGKSYDLLPAGEAVDVDMNSLDKGTVQWLEALAGKGQIAIVAADEYDIMTREDMEAAASALKLKFTKSTTDKELRDLLRNV